MTATQRFVCYGVLAAIGAASNLGCGGDAKLEKDVPAAVEGIILNLSADVSSLTETSYRQAKVFTVEKLDPFAFLFFCKSVRRKEECDDDSKCVQF